MWVRRALIVTALGLVHARGAAAPAVRVEGADAQCPDSAEVAREIRGFTTEPQPQQPHYRLEIVQRPHGARANLYDVDGVQLFSREIDSSDCRALARAFALIVHAHFVDLGIVERRSSAEPPAERAEETRRSAPVQTPTPTPTPTRDAEVATQQEPAEPAARWAYRVGVGVGAGYDLPDGSLMWAGVVQAGVVAPYGLWLGVHLRSASPVRVGSSPDRVERWPVGLELGASERLFDDLWLEPGLSAGLLVSRVRALDLDAGARLSPVPVVRGFLRTGMAFSSISPWLELGGQLHLDRDRYLVRPRGSVGLGPRATLSLLLGVDVSWF